MTTNGSRDLQEKVAYLTKKFIDRGKIIEAGWQSMRLMSIPPSASETQVAEMRVAFFAGAQHLFGSIMSMLEHGAEPSENDVKRMALIEAELMEFIDQYKAEHVTPAQGRA